MNWLNIETSTLDSEEFIGSDPVARATWLCLLRYCAGQENDGLIVDCKDWPDRKWQQLARVTKDEVLTPSPLWTWHGENLALWSYPVEKQNEVRAKRQAGRKGGQSKSAAKIAAVRVNGAKQNLSTNQSTGKAEAKQEPNGKEWKGKEGNGMEENPILAPADADAKATRKPRVIERNVLLDTLATIGGGKADEVPPSLWPAVAKALSDIRAVCPELTPDELQRRARNYRSRFPDAALTHFALAKHWATCGASKQTDNGSIISR